MTAGLKATLQKGLIGALMAALLGLIVLWLPFTQSIVDLSYDLPFLFRKNIPVEGVQIVYMDEESATKLHQPWHAEWDRALHAKLIDKLTRWHAKAIVFDVLFLPSAKDPTADAQLVQAVKNSGKVIVGSKMAPEVNQGRIIGWQLTSAFSPLREAVISGAVEESGRDGFIREHYRNSFYPEPSMAWQAAKLANTNAPDPQRERWINYYGPPGHIPHVSYFQALEKDSDGETAFSNKVVFVGAQYDVGFVGGKGTDDYGTPYTHANSQRTPGIEVNATAFLNLVRGDWLFRLSAWAETGLILLTGALAGFSLAAFRPTKAAIYAIAGAFLIGLGAALLVWQTRLWIPWLSVVAVQIPIALGWSVLTHTRKLQREKHSLEQALAMVQRGDASPEPVLGAPASRRPVVAKVAGGTPALPALDIDANPRPTIADHELLRCIGGGAYGKVWLARDIIGSFHAVKVVYRDNFKDSRPLEREFNGLKRFTPISRSHPGFVNILHVGRNDEAGYIYYVMELGDDQLTGQKINPETYSAKTLAHELQKRKALPLPECLDLMIHLADALDYLHRQQLIHRDIKPSNLIFVNGVCKFADIGLVTDMATQGKDVTYLGTPGRIAPEGPGAPASDIYALGKVLYEMAFGLDLERFPELPTSVIEGAASEVLLQVNRIIMKACENDLRKRYQKASDFRADLLRLKSEIRNLETNPKGK